MKNARCLKLAYGIDCDQYSLTVTMECCYSIFDFRGQFSKMKASILYQCPSYKVLVKYHFPAV